MRMSFREKASFNSAQAFLCRSKSLYDGTKSTMRLSNITSKLRTVSATLANTNPFSSKSQGNSITEENADDVKQTEGIKKSKRRTRERTTFTNESSTSASGKQEKPERKKKKKKQKHDHSDTTKLVKTSSIQQTTEYVVQEGDSFNSVAARFDLTPSELCRVNKFLSRTLFVGQVIKLPINEKVANMTAESSNKSVASGVKSDNNNLNAEENVQVTTEEITKNPLDPKVCLTEGESKSKLLQSVDSLTSSVNETDTDDQDFDESSTYSEYTDYADEENDPMACQYLKFDCKFVVDLQCSVPGIILVTTNMFVFKPYDEEQYPLENHCKQIPLSQFRTIAVYRDPSVMYFTKRGTQPTSCPSNVNIECDVNEIINSTEQTPCVIITKNDDSSTELSNPIEIKGITCEMNSGEKHDIGQKDIENVITTDSLSASNLKKCDLDDNPFYLCILAYTNSVENNSHRRHPFWFTVQSEEYWFLIPNEKSKILFDFLLTCQFHGYEDDVKQCTDMEVSQLSIKSTEIKDTNKANTIISKLHSKSLGNLNFFKSSIVSPVSSEHFCLDDDNNDDVSKFEKTIHRHHNHKHTHRHHNYCHFVVVPNTFDWVLPRIGSSDDHSRTLLILNNQQKYTNTLKEAPKISSDQNEHCQQSQSNKLKKLQNIEHSTDSSSFRDTTDISKTVEKHDSVPSMEEEKAALQLLKRETINWELVSSKELELKELEEEKRKQFMFDCIKSAEPELLPIPTATSNSEIFDVHKVRDLLQNLTPDAEGLDWILTYSTSVHGFSLRSLYRRCANSLTESSKDNSYGTIHTKMKHTLTSNSPHAANQPCILIIRTSTNEIFGAMLNTHPYPSNGRFYGNGSCFVFRWINTTDSKQDQLKGNSNSINEQDSISLSVTSNKLLNIPTDVNSVSISSSSLLGTDNHNSDLVSSSSSFISSDVRTETVTKEFAHLCYNDKKEFPEQGKKQTFQKFTWSGENSYFINGDYDSLTIGCSQGHSAIQLDDILLHGHSDNCETFNSPQLTLSSPDFIITTLEIWSFI
ncbi:unnamed protein product [Schistosoma rodhaini]|nr:unnamed protein product [Schistosoma rodhaini]